MYTTDTHTDAQRQHIHAVVDAIETLRIQRKAHYHDTPHRERKHFTQNELVEEVYGAYKNLALGLTRRIPLRADLLHIAVYLECSIHETNELLLTAQYLPEPVAVQEDRHQATIQHALWLLQQLPFPIFITTYMQGQETG